MSDFTTDAPDGDPIIVALVELVRALLGRMAEFETRLERVESGDRRPAPSAPHRGRSIGERLRRYRRRIGLTQFEAADWLDVDQSTIAKWENGNRMDFSRLREIADWIGEPFEELVELYLEQWG